VYIFDVLYFAVRLLCVLFVRFAVRFAVRFCSAFCCACGIFPYFVSVFSMAKTPESKTEHLMEKRREEHAEH